MMRLVLRAFLAVCVLAVAAVTWAALEGHRRFTHAGPLAENTTVLIAKGSGLDAIARRLADAGAIADPYSFMVGVKWHKAVLKAGEYALAAHTSPQDIMRQLAEGRVVTHRLTVAEGLSTKQIIAQLQGVDFLSGMTPRHLGEGSLLPETWYVPRDESRAEIVARMEKAMTLALDQAWAARDPSLPLKSKEQALILASMVERETGVKSERSMVAAVFLNRLKLGMKLQSDPTVIYGVSDGVGVLDRPLTRADLDRAHPWNTYVIPALPLTPIANPGRASIDAVMHPAKTDALYFVADGSGGHAFAKTLDQHNRNVARWREIEKKK